jgi:gliding motility-associated-like protein
MFFYALTESMKLRSYLIFFLLLISSAVTATHNRAGEITHRRLSGYNYEIKIVTYTKTSSPADRPELEFWWGDGTRDTIPRLSIDFNVGPDIQRNTYIDTHTYPGNGTYVMYFIDENRNGGVVNIPGSVNIPFYVETQLVISPALQVNNSPQLLQPPIDDGAVNRLFIHNPNAFDPDGDSLSYELVPCKGVGGQPIPTFFTPPASTSFSLDAVTGDLIWDSPMSQGEFNVAMIIREWRLISGLGMLNIGYVTRDMQITIYPPVNDPPEITAIADTCVEAGTTLAFTVTATDPNNHLVTLTATGGPLGLNISPATFTSSPAPITATGDFTWNTNCAHVRKSPYTVVFKAEDNFPAPQLADLEQLFITVVGPAPTNPTVTPLGNSLILNWDQSICTEAAGYHIYRRAGTFGFNPSHCETGVPAYTGYTRIASVNGLANTTFTDDNNGAGLAPAINYCYMVTAFYPDGAESYASVEFCGRLIRDLPVITNADVVSTDATNGQVYVAWGKPTQLDLQQTPGPYRYVLQRNNNGTWTDVVSLFNIDDTTYTESGLATLNTQYEYRIQFWNDTPGNTFLAGTTQTATTVFLSATPGDEKNRLSWALNVPWTNSSYTIYRENLPGVFDSIGFSTSLEYIDDSLQNGTQYCYYVRSTGAYPDTGLVNPILNRSQITCATPVDNEPPCLSALNQVADCEQLVDSLYWTLDDTCASDLEFISVYYATSGTTDFQLIQTISGSLESFVYTSPVTIAGCYYLVFTDSAGNQSEPSNQVCVDACPAYELPNIFTPDDDGINDIYHPILPYRDIREIDMIIWNRWGDEVFSTKDPDINWNGRRNNDGEILPDGVYYYRCLVDEFTSRDQGNEITKPRVLTGFIHITRGGKGN